MMVLNPEQSRQLLAVAAGDRLEALYVLILTTGMREGELLGLKWADVDLEGARLQVQRNLGRVVGHGFVERQPKSSKGRRSIPLTSMAVAALRRHRARQREERLVAGSRWEDRDLVFANTVGRPIEVRNLTRRSFFPLLEKAGLPRIRFYDLRHSAASLLLSLGVHPKVVQELLGHSQISVTLDTYSHVLPGLKEEAVSRLESLVTVTSEDAGAGGRQFGRQVVEAGPGSQ